MSWGIRFKEETVERFSGKKGFFADELQAQYESGAHSAEVILPLERVDAII